jgi:hypothetical protein
MTKVRDFLRSFPRFKRQAEAGKSVLLVDRQGRRFTFTAEKPGRHFGAGQDLRAQPLPPDPIPEEEFKGNY